LGVAATAFVVPSPPPRRPTTPAAKKQRLMTDLLDQAFGEAKLVEKTPQKSGSSEFSRCLALTALASNSRIETRVSPSDDEVDAIAKRIGVQRLVSLAADVSVARGHQLDDDIRIDGDIVATVDQACVATGNPVQAAVNTHFTVSLDDDDEIPYDDLGNVDVGELVLQYLCLEIDPYPRSGDAGPFASEDDADLLS